MDVEMVALFLKSAAGKQIIIVANASDGRGYANLRGRIESVDGHTVTAGKVAGGLHRTWKIQLDEVQRLEVGPGTNGAAVSLQFSAPLMG